MRRYLQDVGRGLIDLVFPASCLYCRDAVDLDYHPALCRDCLSELQPAADQFAEQHIRSRLNDSCLDQLLVAFHFNEVVRALIHAVKYRHMPKLAIKTGKIAISRAAWELSSQSLLVPVPLHPKRQRERGYNQSELIATGISSYSGLPLCCNLLQRSRYTNSQTRLNRRERQLNIANAFILPAKVKKNVAGKDIVLVDDVMTTGTTLNECAAVLKMAGAASVRGIALAAPIRDGEDVSPRADDFLLF